METDRIDVRKLEPSAREQLRRTAIRLYKKSMTQTEISGYLGIRRPTITLWIGKSNSGEDVKEKKRGRRIGTGRRLSEAQEEHIKRNIIDKTPDQLKLGFALWNARAVRSLIKALYSIDIPDRSVRKYLNRWGFTPQRPLKRALEQRPQAVKQWLDESYPAIKERAKLEGAQIHWGDETAVSSIEHYPRGYAPKGKTPVLVLSQSRRHRINLISSITNQGLMRFMLYEKTLNAQVLIKFLARLIKDADKKVFLILDNLKVHHSLKVKHWLKDKADQIELFFLPSYSPDLNPDEYLNCDLKARMSAAEPAHTKVKMRQKIVSHLSSLQKQPNRIRSYFNAQKIQYAA